MPASAPASALLPQGIPELELVELELVELELVELVELVEPLLELVAPLEVVPLELVVLLLEATPDVDLVDDELGTEPERLLVAPPLPPAALVVDVWVAPPWPPWPPPG